MLGQESLVTSHVLNVWTLIAKLMKMVSKYCKVIMRSSVTRLRAANRCGLGNSVLIFRNIRDAGK